ncbi:Hsp20/alpha crystallin family protein [Lactococcus kimchii]|uniref:Hsp20/alpha crystallin family protein n=1 Tax=Lactococcus sp. S-13 TaxID=2507158 RepID=UPI0010237194|nr:Hsp20/alpha crystallin family protein [Lactococcus sp. S-13]RZI49357.1 Hsp20/alpha crystallin family protein [Lactococcus sp. S-13]
MSNDLMNNQNNLMDFGDDFFNHFGRNLFKHGFDFPASNRQMTMKTDVSESDTAYSVKIDLPGLKKENINIEYENGMLSVSGKQEQATEEKNDAGEIIHSERYYGSYSRSYHLPNVERDNITAKYDGGVLTLNLPKTVQSENNRRIEIQ